MALQAIKSFGMKALGIDDNDVRDEKRWVSLVDGYYKKREKSSLQQLHKQWFYNIAMRRGHQWLRPSATTNELIPPSEDENRVRMIDNRMLSVHQTKLAKLTKENPVWTVSIDSDDEDVKDLARNDEILLKAAFQREEIELQRLWLISWGIDTGNCFWKIIWDHEAGGLITDPFTGESVPEGDVRFVLVTPFDFTMAFGTKTRMEDAPWVMHSREETLDQIKDDFPERGGLVKSERETSQSHSYQKKLLALVGNQNEFFGAEENEEKGTAVLKEWYAKPCGKYPEGAYIAVANGRWLNPSKDGKVAPLPYQHLRDDPETPYPFVHFIDLISSGTPWGFATMENLISVQKGRNRALSQVIENGNNFGNIKLLAPKTSDLTSEAFDDSGNEVIEYNDLGGRQPEYLQPAGLPNQVMSQFDLYDKAFMDIGMQFEATKGGTNSGAESGIAIARLQDADEAKVNPTMIIYRSLLRKAGGHVLSLYREFMADEESRTVTVVGYNGPERHKISRDKLANDFQIYVDLESSAAWSKEVKRQQIQNAFQMGLFGDPNNPKVKRRVLESLEFGHLKSLFEESALDELNAKENIDRIENGDLDEVVPAEPLGTMDLAGNPRMNPPVMGIRAEPWEDHEEHLSVYNNFRKGKRWRKWTPEQKKTLNDLAEAHAKFLEPPPPPPIQPKVSISAKTEVPPETLFKATGMEPPTPPPPEPMWPPVPDGIGPQAPPQPAPPGP